MAAAQNSYTIQTFAGTNPVVPTGLATNWTISPGGIAVDTSGNVYIAATEQNQIWKVSPAGSITQVMGTGNAGYSGDNGPASGAQFNRPRAVCVDTRGNIYIADFGNRRIRKVTPAGLVTTIAGNGTSSFGGGNGPATSVQLMNPISVAADRAGNVYIADGSYRIRKVDSRGIIAAFAGNGTYGYSGDNGPAASAQLNASSAVATDPSGNVYIADDGNRIRKVSPSGIITTFAGNGTYGYSGDNGRATSAQLGNPSGIAADSSGNVFIAEFGTGHIRKVAPGGIITTLLGGESGSYAHGVGHSPALERYSPQGVAVSSNGDVYIADSVNSLVRKVSASGLVTIFAGHEPQSFSGDNVPATSGAQLKRPCGVAVDAQSNVYIADLGNRRIRKVSTSGIISTFAGEGPLVHNGNDGPSRSAQLGSPGSVAVDRGGNVYISDMGNSIVRKVAPDGVFTVVAGSGGRGYSGDDGPAVHAQLDIPDGVAIDAAGNVYIADRGNSRVRKVSPSGIITTIAGNGTQGSSGDNGPATVAELFLPSAVAVDAGGNVYIADTGNNRIRKVDARGIITTIAGNGKQGDHGDNGPATSAQLTLPSGVAADSNGNIYIADTANHRIRKVTPAGMIATIAGTGTQGFAGDDGPAVSAQLYFPSSVAVDSSGNVYVADTENHRIRKLIPGLTPASPKVAVASAAPRRNYGIQTIAGTAPVIPRGAATNWSIQPGGVAVDSGRSVTLRTPITAAFARLRLQALSLPLREMALAARPVTTGRRRARKLSSARRVTVDDAGNVYIATGNRICKVTPTGIITTIAGGGVLYIADMTNNRIRKVTSGGVIMTLAGAGAERSN